MLRLTLHINSDRAANILDLSIEVLPQKHILVLYT